MNKIIRDHYPVSKLPEDLRAGLDPLKEVRVVIEQTETQERRHLSFEELKALRAQFGETSDDPAARIRPLRDEWDD
jgi:hypothetical protein